MRSFRRILNTLICLLAHAQTQTANWVTANRQFFAHGGALKIAVSAGRNTQPLASTDDDSASDSYVRSLAPAAPLPWQGLPASGAGSAATTAVATTTRAAAAAAVAVAAGAAPAWAAGSGTGTGCDQDPFIGPIVGRYLAGCAEGCRTYRGESDHDGADDRALAAAKRRCVALGAKCGGIVRELLLPPTGAATASPAGTTQTQTQSQAHAQAHTHAYLYSQVKLQVRGTGHPANWLGCRQTPIPIEYQ